MTSPRLPALIVIALISYSLTFILFPKISPASKWDFALDRETAIARAKTVAAQIGHNTQGWATFVTARYDREVEYYLAKQADSPASKLLTPVTILVKFADQRTGRSLRIDLDPKGNVVGFRQMNSRAAGNRNRDNLNQNKAAGADRNLPDQNPEESPQNQKTQDQPLNVQDPKSSSPTDEQSLKNNEQSTKNKILAENLIKQLFGERFNGLTLSDSSSSKEGERFSWSVSDQQLKLTAEGVVLDSQVKRITLVNDFSSQFQAEYRGQRSRPMAVLSNAENLVIWPAILLIVIFYFIGLALRQVMHRETLVFLVLTFLLLLISNISGSFADDLRDDISINTATIYYWAEVIIPWVTFALFVLLLASVLYLSWAAGLALAIRIPNRRTVGLELLVKGNLNTVPVMREVVRGLLIGGILSAIAPLAMASKLFGRAELNASGFDDLFISRSPSFASFITLDQFPILMTFAFLAPLIDAFVKRLLIARLLLFIPAFLVIAGVSTVYSSAPALVLVAVIETLLLMFVYYRSGLLVVIVTRMASQAALSSAALFAQPFKPLQLSAWSILIGLGTLMLISLVALKKAREVREDEIAVPPGLLSTRSERERLRAEFDVARRAQQQMLPVAPPRIEGLEIAAVCQPSKEVGGDLYDFIMLPEGKLGIVVADVSGKGVPASLYMTLTKGLLDSVSEDKTDPGEILREVNRHLYEVCRRKMFVTLFLGVIDPVRKTLDYARAGHNPTIFHKASDRTTVLLKSPGMGMGLNQGKVFDKSLKVDSLILEPRDMLFFYSDGITEAMNGKNEEYGEERLVSIVAKVDGLKAEEARDLIMADVKRYLGPTLPQDDQTLVVVRVL
jgi:hypothetical protein